MKTDLFFSFLEEQGFSNPENIKIIEPGQKIAASEKILGEMNEFEKILHSLIEEGHLKLKTFEEEEEKNPKKLEEFSKLLNAITEIKWCSIRTRLTQPDEAIGFGVRKDFKIVAIFENPVDKLMESLEGLLVRVKMR